MLIFSSIFDVQMNMKFPISRRIIIAKLITAVLISASVAAFATLGDGSKDKGKRTTPKNLLSIKPYPYNFKSFSLRSGYNYRGSTVFNNAPQHKYIVLNTVVTYEKGNTTYILPLKKKVLLDKIKFNPAH